MAIRPGIRNRRGGAGAKSSGISLPSTGFAWENPLSTPRGSQHRPEIPRGARSDSRGEYPTRAIFGRGPSRRAVGTPVFQKWLRSMRELGKNSTDFRNYASQLLYREATEGIPPALLEEERPRGC